MRYTQKQTEAFVTTWQTSTTVAEVVCRLQEHPDFPDELPPFYGHTSANFGTNPARPLSMKWARQRCKALRREGVPLKDLPRVSARARSAIKTNCLDYTRLAAIARKLA
jgi:hypothetical protein